MYKILFFLHKPVDEKVLNHFKEKTIKTLSELSGKEIFIRRKMKVIFLLTKNSVTFVKPSLIRKMKWIKL